ncbi:MAG TPA: MOSC N-terminal beta barrel domain-containing protein [Candidatus Saccharimonadales bacterium]|nr:MOSC N-terminal beta barrel domain-containing protein [Candidatus Saccharimonadales bacterium]
MSAARSLTISNIFVYPVKSCGGLALDEASIVDTGFDHDREWMVVNEDGWFITQRQYPFMATIRPTVGGNILRLEAPGVKALEVPITSAYKRPVTVWTSDLEAYDQGDTAAEWFSKLLGRECRLVRKTPSMRKIGQKYQVTGSELVGFADSYPFLLASLASLDDLNAHMDASVPITRFRPNIVVAGGEAFQEDSWRRIKIGQVTFRVVKPCSRCEMINVDQQTGERDVQPLDALGGYRRHAKGIWFGQNLVQETTGVIRVGDALEVLE